MQRLLSILAFLVASTWAYAQSTTPAVPSAEEAGTSGDGWLYAWIAIGTIVVAFGIYLFLRRGGRARM
ncbi:hypothetical protein [Microvirga guangxiensis]|uniref:LPXTG-motif cell wall anchor domain-containing protein n=1 Tax=Microvirga guangxiensis TaxID=549386 RepID=A0A1G5J3C3_9HYPH|nr:hypothetical protein [Microvirga guangxiensis]SCY82782.1 hypothetical protein SAMN02927923_02483 [Microvirga guangxiensis]